MKEVMRCCIWRQAALLALLLAFETPLLADVLVGTNGERFVGKVLEENSDAVLFESEFGGPMKVPWTRVRELQRVPLVNPVQTNTPSVSTNTLSVSNANWHPPGVGKDGFDWLQLKSDEWLKGHLDYVQERKVQFESDKLEDLSLKLKDVRNLYTGKPMFIKFNGREQLYGSVVLSNELVQVFGPEQLSLPREQLSGITPGGEKEINFWSFRANMGLSLQSGNTKQTTWNSSVELARRTPATQFLFDYLANYADAGGIRSADNQRINSSYDIRLNRDWFVRPATFEWYRDRLANLSARVTAGVGVGYYIFDLDALEWKVAAGPSYQYTRFETVEAGASEHASTPAAVLSMNFNADITSRLTFIQSFTGAFASDQAGLYSHHFVATLEFEIKRHLDLNMSFVWDYLQKPQAESNGVVPQNSDLRLTLGLGVKF